MRERTSLLQNCKIWIGANNENKGEVKLEHETKFSRTKAKAGCGNINLLKLKFIHYIGNPLLFFLYLIVCITDKIISTK